MLLKQRRIFIMDEKELTPELQSQLDEVEKEVEKNAAVEKRFDPQKGVCMGLLCFGLFFVFGVVMRVPVWNAIGFGFIGGLVGFACGTCQRPVKK